MSDKYSTPSETNLSSDEGESCTEDDFDGIDAEFNETTLTQRVYSKSSEVLLASIEKLWCEKWNAQANLQTITIRTLHNFFFWVLKRRKKTLRSMKDILKALARRFNLKSEKREKTAMYVEDMFEVLKAQWTSPEMTFDHERHRLELSLFMLLAGTTGNRPGALLALRYRDVQATLIRDPAGGSEPYVLLEFIYTHTKGYLGQKDSNTFVIPEIRHDPCLILSPHAYFLALAFSDQAFAASGLTGPEALYKLRVPDQMNQLRLPWKEEMLEVPIFRKSCRTVRGIEISQEPLPDSTVRPWLRKLGEITGMEKICHPYILRYAAGKAFDNCGLCELTVHRWDQSEVFQQHYLPRHISADTQAAYRGLPAQSAVMRAASGMSRGLDARRPRKLSAEQLHQIKTHPKVEKSRKKMDELKLKVRQVKRKDHSDPRLPALQAAKDKAVRAHRNEKRRQKEALLRKARERFQKDQAVADIENLLNDLPAEAPESVKHEYALDERSRAVQALFTLPEQTLSEERRRESRAITALVALCQKKEDRRRAQYSKAPTKGDASDSGVASVVVNEHSESRNLECKPTQCFLCFGDQGLPVQKREKEFCSRADLKKHVLRYHLRHFTEDATVLCPLDGEPLRGHMDVLSHGQFIHGTPFLIR
ncbi:hypothetical protein B0J12DRAFT_705182 [Macrophomina phaseolina]|uniref:C2H2-type domain-containing protein n=1 Tax=Macrophomina phaseolina TaxID=35725 RepID=A0ABQ8FT09_9PEZI|nr:hypothetical protein B0J12DRAFT_705182 [Macrophomina phaseolina]